MVGHNPALEIAAIKTLAAAATDDQVLRDAFLHAGRRHNDLEHRARCELRLDCLVQQRLARIVDQLVPFVAGDADSKCIGVERWPADHRQNLARPRVHGDDGSGPALQRLLSGDFEIEIDGQLELLTRNRRHVAERANFLAATIDQHLPRAVLAHQDVVVILLDSRHADYVARTVQLPLRLCQHFLAHLPDIADHVRHEPVLGIQPSVNRDDVELRQISAMRFDECQLIRRNVVFQEERLVTGDRLHSAQARPQLIGRNVQPRSNLVSIGIEVAVLIAQQKHRK